MKSTSFRVPEEYVKGLRMLVELGVYRSRSEAVRVAVRDLLYKEGVLPGRKGEGEALAVLEVASRKVAEE